MPDQNQIPDPLREGRAPTPGQKSFYGGTVPPKMPGQQNGEIELSDRERESIRKHRERDAFIRQNAARVEQEQSVAAIRAEQQRQADNEATIRAYLHARYPGSDSSFDQDFPAMRASLMARIVSGATGSEQLPS